MKLVLIKITLYGTFMSILNKKKREIFFCDLKYRDVYVVLRINKTKR